MRPICPFQVVIPNRIECPFVNLTTVLHYRLGGEKFKSKGSSQMPTPSWLEQFDLHLFDDQTQELEINICAKERSREEIVTRYANTNFVIPHENQQGEGGRNVDDRFNNDHRLIIE